MLWACVSLFILLWSLPQEVNALVGKASTWTENRRGVHPGNRVQLRHRLVGRKSLRALVRVNRLSRFLVYIVPSVAQAQAFKNRFAKAIAVVRAALLRVAHLLLRVVQAQVVLVIGSRLDVCNAFNQVESDMARHVVFLRSVLVQPGRVKALAVVLVLTMVKTLRRG